jgi:TonB family protein
MRVMKLTFAMLALAAFSVGWAEDVKLVRMSSIPESKILRKVQAAYPLDAVDHHIQGVVKITVLIGTDGHVENIRLVSGHPLLAPAALQAVRQWVFEPTQSHGQAVKVITPITVPFALDQNGNPVNTAPRRAPIE